MMLWVLCLDSYFPSDIRRIVNTQRDERALVRTFDNNIDNHEHSNVGSRPSGLVVQGAMVNDTENECYSDPVVVEDLYCRFDGQSRHCFAFVSLSYS